MTIMAGTKGIAASSAVARLRGAMPVCSSRVPENVSALTASIIATGAAACRGSSG